jgi:hypothetical protein
MWSRSFPDPTKTQLADPCSRDPCYIDLNRVRAGVVEHPVQWANGGYGEIQQTPGRYRLIDVAGWLGLCGGFSKKAEFQQAQRQWVEVALRNGSAWSDPTLRLFLRSGFSFRSDLYEVETHPRLREMVAVV